MIVSVESLTMLLNISLGAVSIALLFIFRDSLFADIAKFMFILAASIMVHALISVFVAHRYTLFSYNVSALIVSICYVLLVYSVLTALNRINETESA